MRKKLTLLTYFIAGLSVISVVCVFDYVQAMTGINVGGSTGVRFGDIRENVYYGVASSTGATGSLLKLQTFTLPSTYTDQFVVSKSGNVGIGTSTPQALLYIQGSPNPSQIIGKDNDNFVMLGYNTTDNFGALSTKEGGVWNGDTIVMKGGRVGMGTTNPDGNLELYSAIGPTFTITNASVNGDARIKFKSGLPTFERYYMGVNGAGNNDFVIGGSQGLYNDRLFSISGDKVGVGNFRDFYALSKFEVRANGLAAAIRGLQNDVIYNGGFAIKLDKIRGTNIVQNNDVLGEIQFNGYDGLDYESGAIISSVVQGTPAANSMPTKLEFKTRPDSSSNPLVRLTIDKDGNVGIGTTTPNARLHVYNTASNAEIDIQSIAGFENHWGIYQNKLDNSFNIWGTGASGDNRLTILSGGNVGIGTTTPQINLATVKDGKIGAAQFCNEYGQNCKDQSELGGGGENYWKLGGSNLYASTTSWNLGIGTTTPATKLEVVGGSIKASGGLIIETRTSDPATPEVGRFWLRTDL